MQNVFKTFLLISAFTAVGGTFTNATAQTRYVSTTGVNAGDCSLPGSPCLTINYAISQAVPGNTILVSPGTYTENVFVNKSLTITGVAGRDMTFVHAATAAYTLHIDGNAGAPVLSGNVTIEGFTFADPQRLHWSIVATDHIASGLQITFRNNRVTNGNRYGWWDYHSHGILLSENNIFSDVYYGMLLEGWDTGMVTIQNNEFTNLHFYIDPAGNPVPAFGGPVGILAMTYSADGGVDCTNPYRIFENHFHTYANDGFGIVFNGGLTGLGSAKYTDVKIARNTISPGATGTGIRLRNLPAPNNSPNGGVHNAEIYNNFISNVQYGIRLQGDNPGTLAYENSLVNSSTLAIENTGAQVMIAECNWYGSAAAASVSPQIAGNVTYQPWLVNGTDDEPATPGFQPVPGSCAGCLGAPTVSFDIGGSSVTSINNSSADPSESATVAVCNGGTYTLANMAHSNNITSRYMISVTPSGGGLLFNGSPAGNGDISAAQFTAAQGIYTVTLSNPAMGGSVVQVITPYNDVDNSGGFNTGDCAGDPVTITYIATANPTFSFTGNGDSSVGDNTVNVSFCSGGNLTLSAFTASSPTAQYHEVRTVTPGLLYGVSPITNATQNITAAAAPGYFGNTYGPYNNPTNAPGTITQVITPYEDLNGNNQYDAGVDCAGTPVTLTITVNPTPAISFTAQVIGRAAQNGNSATPTNVVLNFCTGEFFNYSNYVSVPGANVGVLEVLTGTGNVTYNGAPVSVPRAQTDFGVGGTPGYFAGTYGPYGLSSGTSGNFVETFTPYYDADNSGTYTPGDCLGNPVTITYNVNPRPQLVAHLNGLTVSSNNDGSTDTGSFSVCNNGNIAISTNFSDGNGVTGAPVRIYQTVTTVNASVSFCNNCQALLSGFTAGTSTAVTLTNPALPGTVVITFQAWQDLNNNSIIDGDECTGDPIVYTVTVAPSPAITCPSPFSVNSSTDGTGNCSGTANWTHPTIAPGPCGPITLTMSIDGGNPAVVTPGGPASQVLSVGPHTITYVVSDGNTPTPNTATCSFTITVVDNEPPMVACSNQTVTFNGQNSIPLVASQLVTTTDNCGVQDTLLSISSINCIQLGQVIPVTVTAKDAAGNMSTCISMITVAGLPCGWSHNSGSVGCGSTVAFAPPTGVWSASATNCYYADPYTSDAVAFAQRQLCGNGSITARVTSIGGIGGWAGVTMRETNALGAKKVQLMTNLSNFVRAEVRFTTGGQAYPADLFSFQRFWVRIMRQGNEFTGFVSSDGNLWIQTFSVPVPMNSCIQVGLVMTNFLQNGTGTATFDNVVATGSNVPPLVGGIAEATPAAWIEQPHSFEVYPNPTSGEVNVDLAQYMGRAVRLEVYSLEGKLLQFTEIDEVQTTLERVDLSAYQNGMYLVRVKSAGTPDMTRRVILSGIHRP